MTNGDMAAQLADLDGRLREVEAIQALILRLLATTKPLDAVLQQYGATETQTRAFYTLLDDLVARSRATDDNRPTFGYFQMKLGEIFPAQRNERGFVQIILDTLKLERPAYRDLHQYAASQSWLS